MSAVGKAKARRARRRAMAGAADARNGPWHMWTKEATP